MHFVQGGILFYYLQGENSSVQSSLPTSFHHTELFLLIYTTLNYLSMRFFSLFICFLAVISLISHQVHAWNSGSSSRAEGLYVALKRDGQWTVGWTWDNYEFVASSPFNLSDVQAIYSTSTAAVALGKDAKVTAWGDLDRGGVGPEGLSDLDVTKVVATNYAFAALLTDRTVVAWGDDRYGGSAPSGLSSITAIYSNNYAFVAVDSDGTPTAWGSAEWGGYVFCSVLILISLTLSYPSIAALSDTIRV